jgi:AcrR family transcriptional regulator
MYINNEISLLIMFNIPGPPLPKISEQKRQETFEKILRCAAELFSKSGYHNTQVMDVVRAAGVSAGTFYNYFKDKRELYERITRNNFEALRVFIRELRRPVNIWDRKEQRDKLRATFDALFDYTEQNPQLVYIILRGGFGVDESFDTITWSSFSAFADDLAEDIQGWLNEGVIENSNPYLHGHAFVGMIMQVFHCYLVDKRFSRTEAIDFLIKSALALFDMFLTQKGKQILQKQI